MLNGATLANVQRSYAEGERVDSDGAQTGLLHPLGQCATAGEFDHTIGQVLVGTFVILSQVLADAR